MHVQVTKANALAGGIDHKEERIVPGFAQNHAVARGDNTMPIGLAAGLVGILGFAGCGADVDALVAKACRALTDEIVPVLAEIIAPRIGVILGRAFITEQNL